MCCQCHGQMGPPLLARASPQSCGQRHEGRSAHNASLRVKQLCTRKTCQRKKGPAAFPVARNKIGSPRPPHGKVQWLLLGCSPPPRAVSHIRPADRPCPSLLPLGASRAALLLTFVPAPSATFSPPSRFWRASWRRAGLCFPSVLFWPDSHSGWDSFCPRLPIPSPDGSRLHIPVGDLSLNPRLLQPIQAGAPGLVGLLVQGWSPGSGRGQGMTWQ